MWRTNTLCTLANEVVGTLAEHDPLTETLRYLRAVQGHSGGQHVDPALQDLVLLPRDFIKYIYNVGNSHDAHSITQSGCQESKTCSALHCCEPDVRRLARASRARSYDSQKCTAQK